jgi:hypothetical protein
MKDFTYYNNVKTPYPRRKDIIREIIAKLDDVPLTKAGRIEREEMAAKEGELIFKEKLAEYNKESNNLKEEFWKDCREEFGYDSFLSKRGCEILESKAWQEGRSCGYSEVYNCLCDLSDFVSEIIEEKR